MEELKFLFVCISLFLIKVAVAESFKDVHSLILVVAEALLDELFGLVGDRGLGRERDTGRLENDLVFENFVLAHLVPERLLPVDHLK